ncbi:MAG: ferrous iron transport protein B [Synergistaceae bacterium]|nr:ferrous iron transport protein B [Synergistaceae bacterium]
MAGKVIALAGNPNTGKTSLFNALTGSRQKVGNWPGVTVERKEGRLTLEGKDVAVVDLPGIYSLGAASADEQIASDYLLAERPDLVLVVVDASNLERSLYLVVQLREIGLPLVVALNMGDVAQARGLQIDQKALEDLLGVTVVPTLAASGKGVMALKGRLASLLDQDLSTEFLEVPYGPQLSPIVDGLADLVGDLARELSLPPRLAAIRLGEEDEAALAALERTQAPWLIRRELDEAAAEVEASLGYDLQTALIERRWAFVSSLAARVVSRDKTVREALTPSDRIDRVVTHRLLGLPLVLLAAWAVFKVTFFLGDPAADGLDGLLSGLGESLAFWLDGVGASPLLSSFLVDGVIGGVGSVVVFFPHIFFLFAFIAVLEDSGYMARGAFVMDRIMRLLGLHGKSFMPLLVGFGCNVPSIMATRILERRRDRMITLLVLPFISCSARLPVFLLFAGTFFGARAGTVIFSLYLLGIAVAVIAAKILGSTLFQGESSQFVMELPPYHLPRPKAVLRSAWERGSLFLRKAGTFIFLAVIVVWVLASLPLGVEYGSAESYIGRLGAMTAGFFAPAGFGFWQAAVALLFGFLAKEVVVGTLGTLLAVDGVNLVQVLPQYFSPLSAYAFMVMALLYVPCAAVVAAFREETKSWRWTAFMVLYTTAVAWGLSVAVYQVGRLLGLS